MLFYIITILTFEFIFWETETPKILKHTVENGWKKVSLHRFVKLSREVIKDNLRLDLFEARLLIND